MGERNGWGVRGGEDPGGSGLGGSEEGQERDRRGSGEGQERVRDSRRACGGAKEKRGERRVLLRTR